MSAESDWRWADPSGQQRLVRTDELRAALASGVIAPNTPVWRSGWKEWRPAYEVPELTTSALSSANGVVQNIPPPPLAMVAVQHAYEGEPGADPSKHHSEPPPPPSYIPTPSRPQPGLFHTPSQPFRVPAGPVALTPRPAGVKETVKEPVKEPAPAKENGPSADGSVGLAALEAHLASRMLTRATTSEPKAPPRPVSRSYGDDPHERQTFPGGEPPKASPATRAPTPAPAPAMALTSLVRPSAPPPSRRSSTPPPLHRKTSKPPPPKASKPPPVKDADPEGIEELSGSILLADASGAQKAVDGSGAQKAVDGSGAKKAVDASGAKKAVDASGAKKAVDASGAKKAVDASGAKKAVDASGAKKAIDAVAVKKATDGSGARRAAEGSGAKNAIEELSGSILLADASGPQKSIEELSGSVLLTDVTGTQVAVQAPPKAAATKELSGSMLMPDLSGPQPVVPPPQNPNELSASFLLDAGSTGALPSVESTGQILAAKQVSRAPFAADVASPASSAHAAPEAPIPLADQTATLPKVIPPTDDGSDLAATVVRAPAVVMLAPVTIGVPLASIPTPEPLAILPGARLSAELPAKTTMIGVPPPPELAALQLLQKATALTPVPPPAMGASSVSEPLPPLERSTARLHDFRIISPDPRTKYLVPALAGLGGLVILGMIGLVIGAFRSKPADDVSPASSASSAHASASASSRVASSAPVAVPAPTVAPPTTLGAACTLGGVAHVIAPRAIVQSGVEADVVGAHLSLGFAIRERDGIAVQLDPATLSATKTARAHLHAPDAIRRLVPVALGGTLAAAPDADRANDILLGRRTIPAATPFDIGAAGGGLAWAPYKSNDADVIWKLDGDAPVEAVRAAPLDAANEEAGWAIAFRRGTSIYAGAVNGGATLTPKGPLVKIDGLGPQVGSPTVAAQDGAVLVAWADRAQPSEPWSLRWTRFAPGEASAEAKAFVPSEGGLGEHAMSPAIAAAGQGRFVLVWTEGPVSNHQVRAQTISGSGTPLGNAMAISDSGVNAGQAQLAILPDGHGVVASLASSGSGPKAAYEILATPIVCP